MPTPQKPIYVWRLWVSLGRLALETRICGKDERKIFVLKHADLQSGGEALRGGMEVVEHFVAPPPPHEANCVWIHFVQEEIYGPSYAEEEGTDVGVHEPDSGTVPLTITCMTAVTLALLTCSHVRGYLELAMEVLMVTP